MYFQGWCIYVGDDFIHSFAFLARNLVGATEQGRGPRGGKNKREPEKEEERVKEFFIN